MFVSEAAIALLQKCLAEGESDTGDMDATRELQHAGWILRFGVEDVFSQWGRGVTNPQAINIIWSELKNDLLARSLAEVGFVLSADERKCLTHKMCEVAAVFADATARGEACDTPPWLKRMCMSEIARDIFSITLNGYAVEYEAPVSPTPSTADIAQGFVDATPGGSRTRLYRKRCRWMTHLAPPGTNGGHPKRSQRDGCTVARDLSTGILRSR